MYKSSPAWSIKRKYNHNHQEHKPSPTTYNPVTCNIQHNPSWKIGSSSKNVKHHNYVPAPNTYYINQDLKNKKFGIIGTDQMYSLKKNTHSPSPADYYPQNLKTVKAPSLGSRIQIKIKKQIPGPGAYQPEKKQTNSQGIIISRSQRFKSDDDMDKIPGPGNYELKKDSSLTIAFSKQKRNCGSPLKKSQDPGPGCYNAPSCFQQSLNNKKGFTLGFKPAKSQLHAEPGPCQYDPKSIQLLQKIPSYSIAKKYQSSKENQNPSPDLYNPKFGGKNCHLSIGKAKRLPLGITSDVPGPGAYNLKKSEIGKNYITMAMKIQEKAVKQNPGPCNYSPNKTVLQKRPQSALIGTQNLNGCSKNRTPGPGTYEDGILTNFARPSTAKFAYTKQSRQKKSSNKNPGPGQYNIPSSVAYHQAYQLK